MMIFGEWPNRTLGGDLLCLTPVGEMCSLCEKSIDVGDSGCVMPYCNNIDGVVVMRAQHRTCFLDNLGLA